MATHFSIFTWEIPWTEEPGGVPRVKHNLVTKLSPVPSIYLSVCLSICLYLYVSIYRYRAWLVAQMVNNLPAMQETQV